MSFQSSHWMEGSIADQGPYNPSYQSPYDHLADGSRRSSAPGRRLHDRRLVCGKLFRRGLAHAAGYGVGLGAQGHRPCDDGAGTSLRPVAALRPGQIDGNAVHIGPSIVHATGELQAIAAANSLWLVPLSGQTIELLDDLLGVEAQGNIIPHWAFQKRSKPTVPSVWI